MLRRWRRTAVALLKKHPNPPKGKELNYLSIYK